MARHEGGSFAVMGTRDHPATVEWCDCREAGRPCQRQPGVPCARGRARMSHRQAQPALLSRPLWAYTTAWQTPSVQPFVALLVCLPDARGWPPDAVDRMPFLHYGRVETADEAWNVERPGARPVRPAPLRLVEAEIIIKCIFSRGPRVTGSIARRAPDSDPRAEPTPLCLAGGRSPDETSYDRPRAAPAGRRQCDR
jgi:hypothetical protein